MCGWWLGGDGANDNGLGLKDGDATLWQNVCCFEWRTRKGKAGEGRERLERECGEMKGNWRDR